MLRLAILQQLRGQTRYYLDQGTRLTRYLSAGVGAAIYGNEWGVESGGPVLCIGAGGEYQAGDTAVVGLSVNWRSLVFGKWTDSAGQTRADRFLGLGMGHLLSLEFILEIRISFPGGDGLEPQIAQGRQQNLDAARQCGFPWLGTSSGLRKAEPFGISIFKTAGHGPHALIQRVTTPRPVSRAVQWRPAGGERIKLGAICNRIHFFNNLVPLTTRGSELPIYPSDRRATAYAARDAHRGRWNELVLSAVWGVASRTKQSAR